MKNALKYLVALDLAFVVILAVSGTAEGILSEVIYYLAFLIPIAISVPILCREGRGENLSLFKISGRNLALSSAVFMPAVLVILLISYLTSLLLGLFGLGAPTVEKAPLFEMLLVHALLPAVLEELLFRYLPLRFLKGYSGKTVIVLSALFFALVHCSLFQIPYAFLAGVIFISLDIMFDSLYPSLILHFLNNALSVVSIKYCVTGTGSAVFLSVLVLLAALSALFIYRAKDEYKTRISKLRFDGSGAEVTTYLPLVVPTLAVAIINLL